MVKKINIVFVIPSLVPGGAERVMSFVSQNLDKEKFDSKLLVIGYEKDASYDVNGIPVDYLNKSRVLNAIPSITNYIFKNKPDIVFSSISHLNVVMALISFLFRKTKFIGREATIGSEYVKRKKKIDVYKFLYDNLYNKLDMIVCQSIDMSNYMMKRYQIPKAKTVIINNPISNDFSSLNNGKNDSNIKRFITVGRLSQEKGILRIIKILSKLDFQFTYTLIGDGIEKETIFEEAENLGVLNKIKHIPFTKDVDTYLSKHDLFLQGSYVEGFPNALLESCVAGTPVIAFDVPGGTKEIISNGNNGFLVKTEDDFIKYLNKEVSWNSQKIRDFAFTNFNKNKILNEYEKLFIEIKNK